MQAIILDIDEFKLYDGHRFATIVVDMTTGYISWVQEGKKKWGYQMTYTSSFKLMHESRKTAHGHLESTFLDKNFYFLCMQLKHIERFFIQRTKNFILEII